MGEADFLEKEPKCSDLFPAPQNGPPGTGEVGPLTQALPPDLQRILCGKQRLGKADEDLGPGRAAVISLWLPPPCPLDPRSGHTHLPILYSSGL